MEIRGKIKLRKFTNTTRKRHVKNNSNAKSNTFIFYEKPKYTQARKHIHFNTKTPHKHISVTRILYEHSDRIDFNLYYNILKPILKYYTYTPQINLNATIRRLDLCDTGYLLHLETSDNVEKGVHRNICHAATNW